MMLFFYDYFEQSELPISKCPTKKYVPPPPDKNVNPL